MDFLFYLKYYLPFLPVRTQNCRSPSLLLGLTDNVLSTLGDLARLFGETKTLEQVTDTGDSLCTACQFRQYRWKRRLTGKLVYSENLLALNNMRPLKDGQFISAGSHFDWL